MVRYVPINRTSRGAWMAQSVECPALGFGSGREPRVIGFEPRVRLRAELWSLLGILSFSPCAPLPCLHCLSLKGKKEKKNRKNKSFTTTWVTTFMGNSIKLCVNMAITLKQCRWINTNYTNLYTVWKIHEYVLSIYSNINVCRNAAILFMVGVNSKERRRGEGFILIKTKERDLLNWCIIFLLMINITHYALTNLDDEGMCVCVCVCVCEHTCVL